MRSIFPTFTCSFAIILTGLATLRAQDIDPDSGNATPFPGTPVVGYKLAWSDEFNGTALDAGKWDHRTDTRF